ncbi:hypothetical protein BGW36DRAFT_433010 [Talaromyces proteolyticus]|uniref:Uncharacterized protein n=1 Tax=Talaromyces proteolyticus TaxID=1131652 RepID=A0AAD4KK19_9EURO|nr:uncharacterized protein BGW36DRAFT_433010 [Talaromyces proteolyticus]KAH8690049.1 hypothetical protein BGW36DRAFT_433010 [Talaromyces proteolyticus]
MSSLLAAAIYGGATSFFIVDTQSEIWDGGTARLRFVLTQQSEICYGGAASVRTVSTHQSEIWYGGTASISIVLTRQSEFWYGGAARLPSYSPDPPTFSFHSCSWWRCFGFPGFDKPERDLVWWRSFGFFSVCNLPFDTTVTNLHRSSAWGFFDIFSPSHESEVWYGGAASAYPKSPQGQVSSMGMDMGMVSARSVSPAPPLYL